jgi:hypothetical protein
VLRAYDALYRKLGLHVRPGGMIVACCCTSRVDPDRFLVTVRRALGRQFRFVERLPPEPDHPVGFREADYLKILLFRRGALSPSGGRAERVPKREALGVGPQRTEKSPQGNGNSTP